MNPRFFVYPLLLVALLRLVPLVRADWRWYAMQIAQLALVLALAGAALYFNAQIGWAIGAWAVFGLLVAGPQLLLRRGANQQTVLQWRPSSRSWALAGWLTGGRLGRLYRGHAVALEHVCHGELAAADAKLDALAAHRQPETQTGMVRLWKLTLLSARRDWPQVVEFYERVDDWGTLATMTQARLLVARAYAEVGQVARALRCLQLVALSPRTIGGLEWQLWMTRVVTAALAGDPVELEALLRHHDDAHRLRTFPQFAPYWRGRCALVRGDSRAAVQHLTRAFGLTHPRNQVWREAIGQYLHQAETTGAPVPAPACAAPGSLYALGQEALALAERQTAGWRALLDLNRPEMVTLVLVAVLAVVYLADTLVFTGWLKQPLWQWAGNIPDDVRHGQWWRPVTAMFLHANLLHLGMNAAALWMFGSGVERAVGRWRLLVIFLVAGTLGNLCSVLPAHYDVSVGASGGVFGLIGAFAVAVYRLNSPMVAEARRRLLMVLGLMVAADLTIGWLEPQIDDLAHAAGFVAGVLLALGLRPRNAGREV